MKQLRLTLFATLAMVALMLGACAQLGLTPIQQPEDGLRYGQAVIKGGYQSLTAAVNAKEMTGPEARGFYNKLAKPEADLAAADKVVSALPAGAVIPADTIGRINLALVALNEVADLLRARLPKQAAASLPAKRAVALR